MSEVLFFAVFLLLVAAILLFDLGILSKKSHVVKPKEALGWTLVWLSLALGFYFFLMHYGYLIHGVETTEEIQGLKTDISTLSPMKVLILKAYYKPTTILWLRSSCRVF